MRDDSKASQIATPSYKEVRLEKICFHYECAFSDELLGVSAWVEGENGVSRVSVQGYLWGQNLGERLIYHPLDWWQAFK